MHETPFRVLTSSGKSLFAIQWLPDTDAPLRGAVQIAHGMAEHCLRYREFAAALTASGFAVYAWDHPGHGQSIDADGPIGHFADADGWNLVIDGALQVNREIGVRHPGVPRILFGHSMGAFIARHYALRHADTLSGLVISATGVRLGAVAKIARAIARFDARRIGPRAPSKLMAALSFGSFNLKFFPARTRSDWLSRDSNEVDRYIADPLCGFTCSAQFWVDQLGGIVELEALERRGVDIPWHLPALMLAGTRDPVSQGGRGIEQLAECYRGVGAPDVQTQFYSQGRHEMLNEINRREVHADIARWLTQRFEPVSVMRSASEPATLSS